MKEFRVSPPSLEEARRQDPITCAYEQRGIQTFKLGSSIQDFWAVYMQFPDFTPGGLPATNFQE